MEENKKESDVGLVFLIMLIVGLVLAVMGVTFYVIQLRKENKELSEKQNQTQTSQVVVNSQDSIDDETEEEKDDKEIETKEINEEASIERRKYDIDDSESEVVNGVYNYLQKIYFHDYFLWTDGMPEFSNINQADKDYIATCAALNLMAEGDVYQVKFTIDDFNNMAVKLFGKDADNMISEENLDEFPVVKNDDGTYGLMGFDGSETAGNSFFIKSIESKDNYFYIEQYEYKSEVDEMVLNLNVGDETTSKIYDMNHNLITSIIIRAEREDERTVAYNWYDTNGNSVENMRQYLVDNYADKMSIREIELEGNISDGFVILNNHMK